MTMEDPITGKIVNTVARLNEETNV